jgi:hypothetical protein
MPVDKRKTQALLFMKIGLNPYIEDVADELRWQDLFRLHQML